MWPSESHFWFLLQFFATSIWNILWSLFLTCLLPSSPLQKTNIIIQTSRFCHTSLSLRVGCVCSLSTISLNLWDVKMPQKPCTYNMLDLRMCWSTSHEKCKMPFLCCYSHWTISNLEICKNYWIPHFCLEEENISCYRHRHRYRHRSRCEENTEWAKASYTNFTTYFLIQSHAIQSLEWGKKLWWERNKHILILFMSLFFVSCFLFFTKQMSGS